MGQTAYNQRAIAEALNVSQTTVTKVLNHDPNYRVSPETRERILKAARQAGYKPRRKRRPGSIALVRCGDMSAADHELHLALQEEAAAMSYRLYLVKVREFPTYRELIHLANPLLADAVIIGGDFEPDAAIKLSEIMPVLVHGERDVLGRVDRVRLDHAHLSEELTSHAISCGHRRVAMIVHSVTTAMSIAVLDGYRLALEKAGIEYDPRLVGTKWKRMYHELLGELLDCSPRPTAIVGWTVADHLTILSVLSAMGYRVPQDISYVGWTTSRFTNMDAYPMITCSADVQRSLSRVTIQRLMDRIEDGSMPACDLVVESTIRRGETCVERVQDLQPAG